ncbi:MAG TPA: MarR family transcriptional regulator [Glycomyces sp.]|nr:MarR family transcriptional regulator [Glycomyces sp.]
MGDETVREVTRLLPPWLSAMEAVNERIAREAGVGSTDLTCWHEVVADGPLPAGELARRLRLTTGAVTHLVDRLVDAGVVRRIRDDADRRRVLIEAVPEARERIIDRYERLGERIRASLAGFTAEERAVIARFFATSLRDVQTLLEAPPTTAPAE